MNTTPRPFHAAAVTGAVAATLLGVVAPVHASGLGSAEDLRYEQAVVAVAGDPGSAPTNAELTTRCRKGWKAIAGGQTISSAPQHAISISSLGRPREWWSATWQRHELASTLTGYAVCLQTDGLKQVIVSASEPPANSQVGDVAYCDEGFVVSGGVRTIGNNSEYSLNASYPVDSATDADSVPDDGWRGYVQYAGDGGVGDKVIFDAFCLSGTRPAYRSKTVTVPPFSAVSTRAVCPKRRPAAGGGVYVNGTADRSHVYDSRPWDSGDAGSVPEDGWRGGISNTSDGPLTMTVHAVCR